MLVRGRSDTVLPARRPTRDNRPAHAQVWLGCPQLRVPHFGPSPAPQEVATANNTRMPTSALAPPNPTPAERATALPTPPPAPVLFSYPIGIPGQPLGDGFFIRHGMQAENTWYNPGYWHTGEDWYAIAGDTAGANVYVIADGAVVYVGGNYPGRVVIVRHAGDLYSMYGHLDPHLKIE